MFNGFRAEVWRSEKVLELDGSDGYRTKCMCLVTLNYTLKNRTTHLKILHSIFYQNNFLKIQLKTESRKGVTRGWEEGAE